MSAALAALRRYALARSLFAPAALPEALATMGFVQADPIRAPARAQDLTLRHRVKGYRAGDLERRYPELSLEEDHFVNYGFLTREIQALMHPRQPRTAWSPARRRRAEDVLAFVRERGAVHPREVDAHFQHGTTRNWFGGSSKASTQLLEGLHYRGLLRVARREGGTRVYEAREPWPPLTDRRAAQARVDRLVDIVVSIYAPLPAPTLGQLVAFLRTAVPQWTTDRRRALLGAKARLGHRRIDGVDWYWPTHDDPFSPDVPTSDDRVWLLAPFDPVVWDRRRFELFWGWAYRFEAYVPAPKRKLGYYALPLLWRDTVVGWGNLAWRNGTLDAQLGYVSGRAPRGTAYRRALDEELERVSAFLN